MMLLVAVCGMVAALSGFSQTTKKKVKPATKKKVTPATQVEMPVTVEQGLPQFMGGYRIPSEVVDGVLKLYEASPQTRGMISMTGGAAPVVDLSVKDSLETSIAPNDNRKEWKNYIAALNECMKLYIREYPMAGAYGKFALISRTNIQRYPPGGGYKTFHTERTGAASPEGSRHLVFMTYLNDVTDAGGTEFLHQNTTLQPLKGRTLIWPADWTFTHRGVPSPSQEKTITTGWFNYI